MNFWIYICWSSQVPRTTQGGFDPWHPRHQHDAGVTACYRRSRRSTSCGEVPQHPRNLAHSFACMTRSRHGHELEFRSSISWRTFSGASNMYRYVLHFLFLEILFLLFESKATILNIVKNLAKNTNTPNGASGGVWGGYTASPRRMKISSFFLVIVKKPWYFQ